MPKIPTCNVVWTIIVVGKFIGYGNGRIHVIYFDRPLKVYGEKFSQLPF